MANTSNAKSFIPLCYKDILVIRAFCAASIATKVGDANIIDSAGRVAANASGKIMGLQKSAIYDQDDNQVKTTAAVDDFVDMIIDKDVIFRGQISTFAKADPYTTATSAACYDVAGSAGVQYINAAASSNDHIRVLGLDFEEGTGRYSEIGAYAKVKAAFNPEKHFASAVS